MHTLRRSQVYAALFSIIVLAVSVASAQPRAKRGGAQSGGQTATTASQKTPPATKPSGGTTKPAGSTFSDQQKKNIEKLQSDLNAIKQGSQVTQSQITAPKNDLLAMADGATKPDPALVDKLATDLANALADGKVSNAERARLSQDLYAVMNSANVSTAEVNKAITDAQAILQASGITKEKMTAVVNDLKAIANEAKSNAQSGGGKPQRRRPSQN